MAIARRRLNWRDQTPEIVARAVEGRWVWSHDNTPVLARDEYLTGPAERRTLTDSAKELLKEFKTKAEAAKAQIALGRDQLRAVVGEYQDLLDNTDEGLELLDDALSKISELA